MALNLIPLTPVFLTLHLCGSVGLLLMISTYYFSKRVQIRRPPTVINFWITWIVYSISYTVLFLGGNRKESVDPPQMLCRVQSAMIHGAPPLVATAGLVAMLQTWHTYWSHIRYPYRLPDSGKEHLKVLYLLPLLLTPYLIFLAFAISSAVYANDQLHTLTAPTGLYCTMNADAFSRYSIPLYCMAIAILLGGFEVVIITQWWWARHTVDNIILMKRETEKACLFRVLLFNLSLIILMSCTIIYMADALVSWPYMAQAALPLAAALVFGTQGDFLTVWSFWKRRSKQKPALEVTIPIPSARSRDLETVSRSATGFSMRTPQAHVAARPLDTNVIV